MGHVEITTQPFVLGMMVDDNSRVVFIVGEEFHFLGNSRVVFGVARSHAERIKDEWNPP